MVDRILMRKVDQIAHTIREKILERAPNLPDRETYEDICNAAAKKYGYMIVEHTTDIDGNAVIKVQDGKYDRW